MCLPLNLLINRHLILIRVSNTVYPAAHYLSIPTNPTGIATRIVPSTSVQRVIDSSKKSVCMWNYALRIALLL